jgi:hypothetical protein
MAASNLGTSRAPESSAPTELAIGDGYLELVARSVADHSRLRRLMDEVNGPSCTQPYLVEQPDGRFRLYLGTAAERARTEQGIRD